MQKFIASKITLENRLIAADAALAAKGMSRPKLALGQDTIENRLSAAEALLRGSGIAAGAKKLAAVLRSVSLADSARAESDPRKRAMLFAQARAARDSEQSP